MIDPPNPRIHFTSHYLLYLARGIKGYMTIQKRSIVIVMMFASASILYGAAKYYSSSIILYVAEQSLIQKSPRGTDPAELHQRLSALLSMASDQKAKMEKLLRMSESLEKVQHLSPEELDKLLTTDKPSGLGNPSAP